MPSILLFQMYSQEDAWCYKHYTSGNGSYRYKCEKGLEDGVIFYKLCPVSKEHCPLGIQDASNKDLITRDVGDLRGGLTIMISKNTHTTFLLCQSNKTIYSGERTFVNRNLPKNVRRAVFTETHLLDKDNYMETGGFGAPKGCKMWELNIALHGMEFRVSREISQMKQIQLSVGAGKLVL